MKAIFDMLQMTGGFILGAFYIPSIYRLYKAKSTKELSLGGWLLLLLGLCMFLSNATYIFITTGLFSFFVAEVINVFFCAIYIGQIIYYRYLYKGGR